MQGGELTRSDGANVRRERALPHLECRDRGRSPYRPPSPYGKWQGLSPYGDVDPAVVEAVVHVDRRHSFGTRRAGRTMPAPRTGVTNPCRTPICPASCETSPRGSTAHFRRPSRARRNRAARGRARRRAGPQQAGGRHGFVIGLDRRRKRVRTRTGGAGAVVLVDWPGAASTEQVKYRHTRYTRSLAQVQCGPDGRGPGARRLR